MIAEAQLPLSSPPRELAKSLFKAFSVILIPCIEPEEPYSHTGNQKFSIPESPRSDPTPNAIVEIPGSCLKSDERRRAYKYMEEQPSLHFCNTISIPYITLSIPLYNSIPSDRYGKEREGVLSRDRASCRRLHSLFPDESSMVLVNISLE
jgi:hypothetical protein